MDSSTMGPRSSSVSLPPSPRSAVAAPERPHPALTKGPRRPAPSPRRGDIEGLRAVAVLGVLAFHAGLPFVPGGYVGVDVFFVISGFLITGLLANELRETGRVSFARFYARRIKRLLPSAVLVLVVTAAASAVVLAPLARGRAGADIASAALYVSNWRFAAQQTDYLAASTSPSPVLHYWSLSVEEQYYVLWPLVLVAAVWWGRRRATSVGRSVVVALVGVGLVSLLWSVVWTGVNPPYAFFGTMTRAWELALGGLVALAAVAIGRAPRAARLVCGWAGLAAIGWTMVTFTDDVPFPGSAALIPTLGAAAVLAAGIPAREAAATVDAGDGSGAGSLLSLRPVRAVGRVSYSLYLWHWPPLVLVPIALGSPLSTPAAVVVVLLSAVPAVLSYRYVEEPFRHSRTLVSFPRRAALVAVVLTVLGAGAGLLLVRTAPASAVEVTVTRADGTVSRATVDPAAARSDLPAPNGDGCQLTYTQSAPQSCVYGVTGSDRRLALFGDSHAVQWFPALEAMALEQGWALEVYTKNTCSVGDVVQYVSYMKKVYTECAAFREAVLNQWEDHPEQRPDAVVVASRNMLVAVQGGRNLDSRESLLAQRDGLVKTFDRLRAMDIPVAVVQDTPAPGLDIPDCLSEHPDAIADCSYALTDGVASFRADRAAAERSDVPVVDLTEAICPGGRCAAVIDGMVVYRDTHHLTATFARSLAPEFESQLERTPAWAALT